MVNIEYIADHLIKFEDLSQKSFYPESDFVIDYEIYFKNLPQWHRDDRDIANLYIREARM